MPRAGVDSSELLPLQLGDGASDTVGEQFFVAHDCRERRAQLV
jgi:hypothetical protein